MKSQNSPATKTMEIRLARRSPAYWRVTFDHPPLNIFGPKAILEMTEIIIPQIPGSIQRSHTPRGVVESLLKTKKYALTIAVLEPYFLAGIAATYLTTGRFLLSNHAPSIPVMDQEQAFVRDESSTLGKPPPPEPAAPLPS